MLSKNEVNEVIYALLLNIKCHKLYLFILTFLRNGVLVKSNKVTPNQRVPTIRIRDKNATFGSQLMSLSYEAVSMRGLDEL